MSFMLSKLRNTDQKCIGWFYFFGFNINFNVSTVLFSQCCNGGGEFTMCGHWKHIQLGCFGHTTSLFSCCSAISFLHFTQHIIPQWNSVSVDGCNTGHLVLCKFNLYAMFRICMGETVCCFYSLRVMFSNRSLNVCFKSHLRDQTGIRKYPPVVIFIVVF